MCFEENSVKLFKQPAVPAFKNECLGLQNVWWCSGGESTCQCGGHGFDPWSGRIPHAAEQLSPVHYNYWACALEPTSHNYWARVPRARALQQEKPPQWEARTL